MKTTKHAVYLVLVMLFLALATISWAAKPAEVCGDGKCKGDETVQTCPQDCGVAGYCGDGICAAEESSTSCPADCGVEPPPTACNNDWVCNAGEDCQSCPGDCLGLTTGKPGDRFCCGQNGFCDVGVCGQDCGTPLSDAVCGDGIVDSGEECDEGMETAACDADCTFRFCGDATVNLTAGEECDGGGETAACDADCTAAACGDGTRNSSAGEECDDGNLLAGDGCDASCLVEIAPDPVCGDGNIDPGEECDDGNTLAGDGCDATCNLESAAAIPANQFTVGDSIGEGEAADGTIGRANHQTVWSTGYDGGDGVNSLNERFEVLNAAGYYENDSLRDEIFNRAVSGAVMTDFAAQASEIVAAAYNSVPPDEAGMITILIGNNDVCAASLADMTDPLLFEQQYRAGLDVLAGSAVTRTARIHISGLPAIYWLWNAKRSDLWCRLFAWPFVPCENLLDNPADDCESAASRLDPDTVYPADGDNCRRRKAFHAKIRDVYNPILRDVLEEYRDGGLLPNAAYIDIFNVQFEERHVNGGDCFHPSETGHALLSEKEWCASRWGAGDPLCIP